MARSASAPEEYTFLVTSQRSKLSVRADGRQSSAPQERRPLP